MTSLKPLLEHLAATDRRNWKKIVAAHGMNLSFAENAIIGDLVATHPTHAWERCGNSRSLGPLSYCIFVQGLQRQGLFGGGYDRHGRRTGKRF